MRRPTPNYDRRSSSRSGSVGSSRHTQPIGDAATVAWLTGETTRGNTITAAIPPVFQACATISEPEDADWAEIADQDRALVEHLEKHGSNEWWLGYLDTGAHDVVVPDAARVLLYSAWPYVLLGGGPHEALTWRETLPDLIFPADRTWLISMLWDDSWTSVGGSADLVRALAADPRIHATPVSPDDEAAPPGHISV